MSVPSAASAASSIDWQIVGAAIATLVVAFGATWQGLRKGRDKVEQGTPTLGFTVETLYIKELTNELAKNSETLSDHSGIMGHQMEVMRQLERTMTRQIDISLMQNRKLDIRDSRDHPA